MVAVTTTSNGRSRLCIALADRSARKPSRECICFRESLRESVRYLPVPCWSSAWERAWGGGGGPGEIAGTRFLNPAAPPDTPVDRLSVRRFWRAAAFSGNGPRTSVLYRRFLVFGLRALALTGLLRCRGPRIGRQSSTAVIFKKFSCE